MLNEYEALIDDHGLSLANKNVSGNLLAALKEGDQLELIKEYIKQKQIDALIDDLAEISLNQHNQIKDLLLMLFTTLDKAKIDAVRQAFIKQFEGYINPELEQACDHHERNMKLYPKDYWEAA